MMIVKRILIIGLFLFVVALSTWFVMSSYQLNSPQDLKNIPDTFAVNINVYKLDQLGKIHWTLSAPQAVHYAENDVTILSSPFFVFYPMNQPPWQVKSQLAQAFHGNDQVVLKNNVQIQQLPGVNSHNMTLLTTQLTLYPDQSLAKTDQPVTVIQANSVVQAIGMLANLKDNSVKFLSHMQGGYDRSTPLGESSHPG